MVNATQKRIQIRQDGIKQKIESAKLEGEAKVKSLQAQVDKAKGDTKARLEKLAAEVRAAHETRVQKLS